MKARQRLLLTLILFLTVASQGGKQSPPFKPQTVAFVGVNVVPMDQERVLTGQTVVVKEGSSVESPRSWKRAPRFPSLALRRRPRADALESGGG